MDDVGPPPSGWSAKTAGVLALFGALTLLLGTALSIPSVASISNDALPNLILGAYLVCGIGLLFGAIQLLRRKIHGLFIVAGVSAVMAVQTLAALVLIPDTAGDYLARFIVATLTAVLALLPSSFRWCRHVPYGV